MSMSPGGYLKITQEARRTNKEMRNQRILEQDGLSIEAQGRNHKNERKWSGKCRNGKVNRAAPTSFCVTHTQICRSTTICMTTTRSFTRTLSGTDCTQREIVIFNDFYFGPPFACQRQKAWASSNFAPNGGITEAFSLHLIQTINKHQQKPIMLTSIGVFFTIGGGRTISSLCIRINPRH